MTKVRSREECLAAIQADSAWRKKELATLKGRLTTMEGGEAEALRRSAVVMVYAHWEGFVKTAAELYLLYINELILRRAVNLSEHFKNLLMWKMLKRKGDHLFLKNPIPFLDMRAEWPCPPDELLPAEIIDTESNLNSQVLRRLIRIIDLDYTFFETKEKLIDESLLKTRNQIAHGNRIMVATVDYETIEQEVRAMIDKFQGEIENSIQIEAYRAN